MITTITIIVVKHYIEICAGATVAVDVLCTVF